MRFAQIGSVDAVHFGQDAVRDSFDVQHAGGVW